MSHLLDLRFADDILLFGESARVLGSMLDALVTCLEQMGLKLNASKTEVLTRQAQPPSILTTPVGLELEVFEKTKKPTNGLDASYQRSTCATDNKR